MIWYWSQCSPRDRRGSRHMTAARPPVVRAIGGAKKPFTIMYSLVYCWCMYIRTTRRNCHHRDAARRLLRKLSVKNKVCNSRAYGKHTWEMLKKKIKVCPKYITLIYRFCFIKPLVHISWCQIYKIIMCGTYAVFVAFINCNLFISMSVTKKKKNKQKNLLCAS